MQHLRVVASNPPKTSVIDAMDFARMAHDGQKDKAGLPYFAHLNGVFTRLNERLAKSPGEEEPWYDDARQIAWLHDVIEDTKYTAIDLLIEGFPRSVVYGVAALTKCNSYTYVENIDLIASLNDLPVIFVKIADIEDNSDPERIALLPKDVRARLQRKYGLALPKLIDAIVRLGWREEEFQ